MTRPRGHACLYDPAAIDTVIAEHFARETPRRRLHTATGLSAATTRADVAKGR